MREPRDITPVQFFRPDADRPVTQTELVAEALGAEERRSMVLAPVSAEDKPDYEEGSHPPEYNPRAVHPSQRSPRGRTHVKDRPAVTTHEAPEGEPSDEEPQSSQPEDTASKGSEPTTEAPRVLKPMKPIMAKPAQPPADKNEGDDLPF